MGRGGRVRRGLLHRARRPYQDALVAGERVLVTGAAGDVGLATVQLAGFSNAEVVATVRDPRRRADVTAFGARIVPLERAADHAPYDVVVELVGAPNLAADLALPRAGGRIVVIGVGAGAGAKRDLRALVNRRSRVMASTLRGRSIEEKATVVRRVGDEVIPCSSPSGR